jgi:peptidyl-prolyl cis-trans isomerase D
MMRSMRAITKPIFLVIAITFIGWMVYGQISALTDGSKDVVLKVDGDVVRTPEFQQRYQTALEQRRRQPGLGELTREDEQQLQKQVADQVIQDNLLERAYRRLGITVSDQEIIEAARSGPPPQILQQVLQDPIFQTNGQFDITKWQRYVSSAGPEFSPQIERRYRAYLPRGPEYRVP